MLLRRFLTLNNTNTTKVLWKSAVPKRLSTPMAKLSKHLGNSSSSSTTMNMVSKIAVGMKVDTALGTPTSEKTSYFCKSFSTSTIKSTVDEDLMLEEGEQVEEEYEYSRKGVYVADKGRSIVEDVDVIGYLTGDNLDHQIAAEIYNSIKRPKLKRYIIEENIEKYVKYAPKINKILQEMLFERALEEDYILGKRVLDAFLDNMPQITGEPYVTNMLNVLMMQTRYQKRRRNFYIRDRKTCIGYFHEYVDNKGVKPDTVTCHLLMANYLDDTDTVYKALEFFEHMAVARIPYDEKIFNQFIVKLSLLNNSIDSAYEYLYKMQLAGITKKVLTYESLFFLHAKGLGTLEDIEHLWKEMKSKDVEPRIETYNSMISGVIKLAPPGEARVYAEKYFNLLLQDKNVIEYSNETYEYLLRSYVADNNLDGLLIYWDSRSNQSIGEHKTSNAWTLLFLCILQQNNLEKLELIHKYFKNMQAEGRRENQNQRIYHIYLQILNKIDRLKNEDPELTHIKLQNLYAKFVDEGFIKCNGLEFKYFYLDRYNETTFALGLDYCIKHFVRSPNPKLTTKSHYKNYKKKHYSRNVYSNLTIYYSDHDTFYVPNMLDMTQNWLEQNNLHYTVYPTPSYNSQISSLKSPEIKLSVRWQDIVSYQIKHTGYPNRVELQVKKQQKKLGVFSEIYADTLKQQQGDIKH